MNTFLGYFNWVFSVFRQSYHILDSRLSFNFGGWSISLWDGIMAFLFIGVVVALFRR